MLLAEVCNESRLAWKPAKRAWTSVAAVSGAKTLSAQTADASNSGNAALKPAHQETDAPPSAGASSFTEAQAKQHLRNAGYTDVTGMTQDSSGVWHGTAAKGGKTSPVSVDFKGDISTQ